MKMEQSGYVIYNEDETKAISWANSITLTKDPTAVTLFISEERAKEVIGFYNCDHKKKTSLHIKVQTRKVEIY